MTSPPDRQSHVRARATAGHACGPALSASLTIARPRFHPSNQRADEAGRGGRRRASAQRGPCSRADARSAGRSEARRGPLSASAGDDDGSASASTGPFRPAARLTAPGEPRPDRLHAAPERFVILRLDDQMSVIPLQRVLRQAKPGPLAPRTERLLDLPHHADIAERRNVGPHPKRHVRRQRLREDLPRNVRHRGSSARLPTGIAARPTPPRRRMQVQSELGRLPSHLDLGHVYTEADLLSTRERGFG